MNKSLLHEIMDELLANAFDAGFGVSGEGWNGEYPNPTTFNQDEYYLKRRNESLQAVIAEWQKRRFSQ